MKLNSFLKFIIAAFILFVSVLLLGRNHFFLGTGLIIFRWILVALGLTFLWITYKRSSPKYLKVGLIISVSMIALESGWNKIHERKLASSKTSTEVKLMTYNIFFRNFNIVGTFSNIKKFDPDILTLQELTPDLKTKLEKEFSSTYPYKRTHALKGTHGIGIYSKHPITSSRLLMNSNNHPFAQIIEIKIGNKKIAVYNVHLASPAVAVENSNNFWSLYSANYDQRKEQLSQISQEASNTKSNNNVQLIMGDLNTTRYEPLYRETRTDWVNLYDHVGSGFGFNFPHSNKLRPVLTLDYILAKGSVKALEMNVVEGGGSDHLAIVGKIRI